VRDTKSNDNDEDSFFTPAEVAKILKVSRDTVIRHFARFPGVIDLGAEEKMHKRQYRILRIPRASLNRFLAENRVR
jgi:hypothetical protein